MNSQNTSLLSEKMLSALEFAAIAHRDQMRKGNKKVPYISHPAAVGIILSKAGYNEGVIIAGILHDVIEDTEFGYKEIEQEFGKQIADWVKEVSENKSLPFDDKKEAYLTHLETASPEAKAISAADLMANRYDMLLNMKDNFFLWKNTPAKNAERDLRRIEIVKQVIHPNFAQELEEVTRRVHKHYENFNNA